MSGVELPIARVPVTRPTAVITRDRYEQLAGRVRLLSWLSLGWMTIEGAGAITAGILASSIALVGFGLDSAIEGIASVIIIWRFTGHRVFSHAAEQRAEPIAVKLCRHGDSYVYEIDLLRRDGRLIHSRVDARSGHLTAEQGRR